MEKKNQRTWVEGEWIEVRSQQDDEGRKESETKTEPLIILTKEHQRFYDKIRKKIEEFIHKQANGRMNPAVKYLLLAPDLFVLLARLVQDKRVTTKSKAILGIALTYFLSPIDLIPEILVGPIGYLDDIVLAAYALSRVMTDIDKDVIVEHWSGTVDLLTTVQELLKKAEELVDSQILNKLKKMINKN